MQAWLPQQIREQGGVGMVDLPDVDYRTLSGPQQLVFLQTMAWYKALADPELPSPPPLRINIDGTAGTGKSYLIAAICTGLKELSSALGFQDPCI